MSSITLAELQQTIDDWIQTYGIRYFSPLTNLAQLTEEVGEVARILARTYGEQSPKNTDDISKEALADELADVLWVTLCLANQTGCDLTEAIQKNIKKKTERDRHRHIDNPKLTDKIHGKNEPSPLHNEE